jgi:GNAT superfamily N-acetyltransferase
MTFVAREVIDSDALMLLLHELRDEDCGHSWKRHANASGSITSSRIDGLIAAENDLRPTRFFTYYVEERGREDVVGVGTIAERIHWDARVSGFPVIARCYVRPSCRGRGWYRAILEDRIARCAEIRGAPLRGIHLGTNHPNVARTVLAVRTGPGPFVPVGRERLVLPHGTTFVTDYVAFAPAFADRLRREAERLFTIDGQARCLLGRVAPNVACEGLPVGVYPLLLRRMAELRRSGHTLVTTDDCAWESLVEFLRAIPLDEVHTVDEETTVRRAVVLS